MTRRPGTDVLVLGFALALAILPLAPVFGPAALLGAVAAGLLVGAVVALASATFRWGVLVTMAVALTGYLLVGPAVAVPESTVLRVVPTPEALLALLTGAVTSWKQVLTLDPELGTAGNLLVAPFLLALVSALGAMALALRTSRRTGALAALVPPGVLALSVLLGTKVSVWPVPAGIALVLGLGCWASWRVGTLAPRRVASLVLVIAVVAGLGAVSGPWVGELRPRYVLRDEIVPPFDPADEASPLSAFRQFIKEWNDTDLLTVRGLPEGGLVRLATLDAFDGVVWDVAGAEAAQGSGTFRRVGSEVDTQTRSGRHATVEIEVEHLPFVWLPTVGWTQQVDLAGRWADRRDDLRYNEATGTAALVGGVPDGLTWTADAVVPATPDPDTLERAVAADVVLPEDSGVPPAVVATAAEQASDVGTPSLIADRLQSWLHDEGFFSHGLAEQGEVATLSGHGASQVTRLLTADVMVGDGEQYASAMALMARELGLPARVVLGFRPTAEDTGEAITFTGADIQAWVEIAYEGYGWVPYFPTPEESRTPDQDADLDASEPQPEVRQPPPPPADPVTVPDDDTEQPQTDDESEQEPESRLWAVVRQVALVGGVPLVLVLGPPVVVAGLKRRRRRRRERAEDGVQRVVGGWDELLDVATDMRRPLPDQATRRELAVALASSFGPRGSLPASEGRRAVGIGGPVATLASRADAVVFGGQELGEEEAAAYWQQVDAAVEAMRRAVPARTRWRARWSPRSLRRRPRGRVG